MLKLHLFQYIAKHDFNFSQISKTDDASETEDGMTTDDFVDDKSPSKSRATSRSESSRSGSSRSGSSSDSSFE